jgi:1,4-dihydroxy-2-naphthoate octaprenyltransferase
VSAAWRGTCWTLVVHLRPVFQLLLAPIFLWGWLLSGGGWSPAVVVAFVAFHLFLYGGATAFNSYYDRDVGPVGGLATPPPVADELLPFSLAVQALGALLAWLADPLVFAVYVGFLVLSLAYSHPRVRLKARPITSLVVVGLGQGVLAFLGAWAANRRELASAWSAEGVLGAAAAALVVVGLYPLTQLFQVDEDRARGDRTFAVTWGAAASFGVALLGLLAGGVGVVLLVGRRFGALDAGLVGLGLLVQLTLVGGWARAYDAHNVLANYRRAMRLNATFATALGLYLLFRLVSP